MYTEVGTVSQSTISELRNILLEMTWWKRWEHHVSEVTDHQAAPCDEPLIAVSEIADRWPVDTWRNLSFLRLKPEGKLYRHHDDGFGFLVPVETNEHCISLSYENGVRKEQHLEVGKIYSVDRSIEHESFNNGETDRTHLIVLIKEAHND